MRSVKSLLTEFMIQLKKIKPATLLAILLLLGLVMRLPQLDGSLWLDEAAQALESARPFSQQLQIRDDFQPPLIHLIVFVLLRVSNHEAWLRLGAALIPGLVTLWATIKVGQKYFSAGTGWMAGLLLATSSFHIFYSQELRPYSLPTVFALLSWLQILSFGQKSAFAWQKYIWLGLWSALGLYSSYLYPFVLVGQFCYVIFTHWRNRTVLAGFVISNLLAVLSFTPWVPSFLDQVRAGQQLRATFPGWEEVVSFTQLKALGLTVGKFIYGVLDLSADPLYFITFGGIVVLGLYLTWKLRHQRSFWQKSFLLLCWGVIPIALAWVVSFWIPILQPKRVLFALPAFYLAFSYLITQAIEKKAITLRWSGISLGLLLLLINLFSSFSYFTQTKYQRENWREVHAYIDEKYSPADSIVLFSFPQEFASWAWYNDTNFPTAATGVFVVSHDPASLERQLIKQLTDYDYILVFDYLLDLSDPEHIIQADLERYGFQQVDVIQGNAPLGMIRVYAQARQIIGFSQYCRSCYEDRH